MKANAELDVIVYGATGYTGQLVAEHFAKRYGAGSDIRWGIAGRNLDRLARVRDEIGASDKVPLIAADASDRSSLKTMAERAKVIVTTVGPYQLYGSELVAVCAASGTDTLNLTGEPHWMRAMIDAHDQEAKRTGARIIHSCGFDSIPFELGVYFTQALAKAKFGHPVKRVKGRVRAIQGGLSGGTAASGRATREAAQKDPSIIKLLLDPFALTPGFKGADQPRSDKPQHDEHVGAQVAPFMMAPINSKNIHRSNLLQGQAYGTSFVYDEMAIVAPGGSAADFVLPDAATGPKPGEGPTKDERENGFYDLLFIGIDASGAQVRGAIYGKKDPGYGSTAMILAETAICLLQKGGKVPGGVWLPGAALGQDLIDRLQAHAGLSFKEERL
jgi:short subunit dehydrogenase-like uncharacterized protein